MATNQQGYAIDASNQLLVDQARLDPTNDQVSSARYNGSTFDTEIGNQDQIPLALAIRTGTTASADILNPNARGALFILTVNAVPGTDTITFRVDAKDPATGSYPAIFLAGAAVSATGTYKYMIYPGASSGTGSQLTAAPAGIALPRVFRVQLTHSAGTSFTYAVGMSLIV